MVGALPVLEHNLMVYRRSWRGSAFVSFLSPVLFLTAIGIGLGTLVNRSQGGVGGVPYVEFLAPGLLAANAVQTAAAAGTYPVMAKVTWYRTYEAMLTTPVAVTDIVLGELAWFCFRLLLASGSFFLVMTAFGVVRSPWGLLAVPAAVLTGLAFGMPVVAFAVTQRNDSPFSLIFRAVVLPLFLFSGTFFPLDRLPAPLQAAAWLTPLYHGVSLTRGLTLGGLSPGAALLHVGVLLLFLAVGLVASRVALAWRLVK